MLSPSFGRRCDGVTGAGDASTPSSEVRVLLRGTPARRTSAWRRRRPASRETFARTFARGRKREGGSSERGTPGRRQRCPRRRRRRAAHLRGDGRGRGTPAEGRRRGGHHGGAEDVRAGGRRKTSAQGRGGRRRRGRRRGGRVVRPGNIGALGTLARRTSASPGVGDAGAGDAGSGDAGVEAGSSVCAQRWHHRQPMVSSTGECRQYHEFRHLTWSFWQSSRRASPGQAYIVDAANAMAPKTRFHLI